MRHGSGPLVAGCVIFLAFGGMYLVLRTRAGLSDAVENALIQRGKTGFAVLKKGQTINSPNGTRRFYYQYQGIHEQRRFRGLQEVHPDYFFTVFDEKNVPVKLWVDGSDHIFSGLRIPNSRSRKKLALLQELSLYVTLGSGGLLAAGLILWLFLLRRSVGVPTRSSLRRILIAPDKFKGTLSAPEAARAMEAGVRAWLRESENSGSSDAASIEIISRPLADGGEGSLDVLAGLFPDMEEFRRKLQSAVGTPIQVPSLRRKIPDAHREDFYLETARVIGLELDGARSLPVMERTTAGIGEWIAACLQAAGSSDTNIVLHLFLGGSATSDGGFGLARALGFRFYDARGNEVPTFPEAHRVASAKLPDAPARPVLIQIYTDVENPLTGPTGAARLFAPQKGATPEEVEQIEERLGRMRSALMRAGDRKVEELGMGAAGGLALPLLYWPGTRAEFRSGARYFLQAAGVSELLRSGKVDLVLSGEGRTDRGTLEGKIVKVLGDTAQKHSARVTFVVCSGRVEDVSELRRAGMRHLLDTEALLGPPGDLAAEAGARLEETVRLGLGRIYGPRTGG